MRKGEFNSAFVVYTFVDTHISRFHVVASAEWILMLYASLTTMVDAKDGLGVLIFGCTAFQVEIVVHKVYAFKHTVHCHKAFTRFIVEPKDSAFAVSSYLMYVRAEACFVEHIEKLLIHAIPAFSKCFFMSFLPRSPPIIPQINATANITGHIHVGISFVTVSM